MDRDYRIERSRSAPVSAALRWAGSCRSISDFEVPHIFGKIAALSPSVWWNQRVIDQLCRGAPRRIRARASGWTLARAKARALWKTWNAFATFFCGKGWQYEHDLHYERVEGAEHNEAAWAAARRPLSAIFVSRRVKSAVYFAQSLAARAESNACRTVDRSPFFASAPTKRARNFCAPAKPWAAGFSSDRGKTARCGLAARMPSTKCFPCRKNCRCQDY